MTTRAAATNMREYVDYETGDIQEGRFYSRAQIEAYERKKEREHGQSRERGRNFIAMYTEELRQINRDLTLIEAGALMRLLNFMKLGGNGKLISNNKPLNFKDIQDAIGRGKDATRAILTKLEEIGIVETVKEGRSNVYIMNPAFHQMGGRLAKQSFVKLHTVKARDVVAELSIQECGLLWKALPYFHYSSFILAENPDEQDFEKVQPMNRETLAHYVGHDRDTVGRLMNGLRKKYVVATMESGPTRDKVYTVNPQLAYRMDHENEWARVVRGYFHKLEMLSQKTKR